MATDPLSLVELLTKPWPPSGSPGPSQATMQVLLLDIAKRIAAMPTSGTAYKGQLVVFAQDGSGPKASVDAGVPAIDLGGLPVKNGKTDTVTITGSGVISDVAHRGRDLIYAGTGSATLAINADATGSLGVTSGFNCHLYAAYDGGSVGVLRLTVGAGITLQRPDANLRVPPGNGVAIKLIGTRLFLGNAIA